MSDYIEELDHIVDGVVKLVKELEDKGKPTNIRGVIKKGKDKGISNSDTLLRDVIISAGGKGKLKIRRSPPNQLLLEVPPPNETV
jgi:hypothetical protein